MDNSDMKFLNKSFRMFELETNLEYLDKIGGMDGVANRLKSWDMCEAFFKGCHYKDRKKDNKTPREKHAHFYIKLRNPSKASTILGILNGFTVNANNYIAPDLSKPEALGVGFPQLENIKSSFAECFLYIQHKDEKSLKLPYKEQYELDDPEFHYEAYGMTDEEIESDATRVSSSNNPFETKSLGFYRKYGKLIEEGKITRSLFVNKPDIVPHLDYLEYKTQFEHMFERLDRIKLAEINERGIQMEVIYCYGETGTGKTTYAKQYCKERGLEYFVSGSSNDPFDGYLGEDVIILDDLRDSAFAFEDLLKILDNNTRSQVKSRYYNKVVAAKIIFITSPMPISELYSKFDEQKNYKDSLDQLKRRCKTVMKFTRDDIHISYWNSETNHYDLIAVVPNTVLASFKVEQMTDEDKVNLVAGLFKGLGDVGQYMQKNSHLFVKPADEPSDASEKPSDKPDRTVRKADKRADREPITLHGNCPCPDLKVKYPTCKGCCYYDGLGKCYNSEHPCNKRRLS